MHRDGAPAHRQERRLNSAARGTADNRSAQPAPDRATGTAKGPKGQQGNAGTTATPASRARPPHAHAGLARGEGRKRSRGQVGRSNASGTAQAGMSGETVTHRVRQRWRGGSAGPPHHQSKSAVVKRKASRRSSRRRGGERRRRPDRPFPLRRGTTQWGLTATSAPISCAARRANCHAICRLAPARPATKKGGSPAALFVCRPTARLCRAPSFPSLILQADSAAPPPAALTASHRAAVHPPCWRPPSRRLPARAADCRRRSSRNRLRNSRGAAARRSAPGRFRHLPGR